MRLRDIPPRLSSFLGLVLTLVLCGAVIYLRSQIVEPGDSFEPKTAEQVAEISADELAEIINEMGKGVEDVTQGLSMVASAFLSGLGFIGGIFLVLLIYPYSQKR